MEQYSEKNQQYILSQLPTATDVRPFKAWKAAGRSVRKGEKALRVWIPKRGKAVPADLSTMTEAQEREYFVRGPVFDISQTKECAPRHRNGAASARAEYQLDQDYNDFDAAISAGDIPADMDMGIWLELREETRRRQLDAELMAMNADGRPVVIAEYRHIEPEPVVFVAIAGNGTTAEFTA